MYVYKVGIMYLFYIDESGEIAYNSKTKYFVLNALGIDALNWKNINKQVNDLKKAIFKTNNTPILEIKSNWLRNPHEREKRAYLSNLTKEELEQLVNGLYDIILNNDCVLISMVINKDSLLKKYGLNTAAPNIFAIEYLLERISIYMDINHKEKQALIVMDKCSDNIEKILNKLHTLHLEDGYSHKKIKNIIENIMFVDSQYNNFIQLTDLCAYNINRAFREDNPNYKFFQLILPKFAYKKEDGILNGAGITYKIKEVFEKENPKMYKFLNSYRNENSVLPNGKYTA